jgi:hypothetical protein
MAFRQRIYQATETGSKAVANPPAGVSFPCRRILGLLQGDTHFAVIRSGMGMCDEKQVGEWLQQLETLGLVKWHVERAESDLDFTGSLSLATLAARHNAG